MHVNAVEEEEEPTEIQGESSIASGFIDEPGHIDGAHVILANELSDAESSLARITWAPSMCPGSSMNPEAMLDSPWISVGSSSSSTALTCIYMLILLQL